jgi:chromate transport protein ChrA
VPFLQQGVVQQYGWLGEREFLIAVATGMISPGPVVSHLRRLSCCRHLGRSRGNRRHLLSILHSGIARRAIAGPPSF